MRLLKFLKYRKLVLYSLKRNHRIPLFSDGMVEYIDLHVENGLPVDMVRVNSNKNGHYKDDLIFQGINYLENIACSPIFNEIKICFEIIENDSINAFATKIHNCSSPTYLVAINSGLVREYVNHFVNDSTIGNMIEGFKSVNQVHTDHLKDAALSMAICFIAFHELGHIFRGHLNYLKKKYSVEVIHEISANKNWIDGEAYNEIRHLLECDADAFAGSLMFSEVISRYKNGLESDSIVGDQDTLLEELAIFCGSIIYYIFCLFDRNKTKFDGYYPVPPIRALIAMGHLGAQLYKEGVDEFKAQQLLIESLVRAQVVINRKNIRQTTKSLDAEYKRWSAKYMEKLKQLEKVLVPYIPIKAHSRDK